MARKYLNKIFDAKILHIRVFLIIAVPLIFVVFMGGYYRHHLAWKYTEWRCGLHDIKTIPDTPMPKTDIPLNYVKYSFGNMALQLPSEMTSETKQGKALIVFQDEMRKVVINLPTTDNTIMESVSLVSHLNSTLSASTTLPKFRLMNFRESADNFRWSMSSKDVRWHNFCITSRQLFAPLDTKSTESFFGRKIDGVLLFPENEQHHHVLLNWQCSCCMLNGYVHFFDKNKEFDQNWVRSVCQSISCSCDQPDEN